jgi:hypothetical protein
VDKGYDINYAALIYAILHESNEEIAIDEALVKFELLKREKKQKMTFTPDEVLHMKDMRGGGMLYKDIANSYCVSILVVYRLINDGGNKSGKDSTGKKGGGGRKK